MSAADVVTSKPNLDRSRSRPPKRVEKAGNSAKVTRPFCLRGFTSILLMLCATVLVVSGIVLYLAPRGRVANWSDWAALSLGRHQWIALHINASLMFVVVTVGHLAMNWSRLVGYLKKRSRLQINMKKELAAAVALASLVFAATVLELPPINLPVEFKYELRDSWEQVELPLTRQSPVSNLSPVEARWSLARP